MQIIHMPALFMAAARHPLKDYADAREQGVRDPYRATPTALDIAKAQVARDREREQALAAMPDDAARERLRLRFADADDHKRQADVEDVADLVSQHRFGCTLRCCSQSQREALLIHIGALLVALDRSPYA